GYGQGGYAPGGPPPGGAYGPPGPWGLPPGAPTPRRRRSPWFWGGIAGALVLVLLLTAVVLVATGERAPQATVEAATADLRCWEGATYSGQIPDGLGGRATLEVTVDRLGNAAGTVTRASGGRAEFVSVGTSDAVRGDRAWWERSAERPELVDRFTGVWLSEAGSELPSGLGTWTESPSELADGFIAYEVREEPEEVVEGRDVRVIAMGSSYGSRVVVEDAGDVPTLVRFDQPSFGTGRVSPVTVHRAAPQALSTVRDLTAQLPTMKSYYQALSERPRLALTVEGGAGECSTPTCTVTVRLVNTGTLSTTGTVVVTLNGAEVARHPFSSAPGSDLAFPTTADNPVYSSPGARISAYWYARVDGGR
ncbi:MAG: hypothetical protein AVDCRST_MAG54-2093, partial [uncultured Actinomycetospora sp.]